MPWRFVLRGLMLAVLAAGFAGAQTIPFQLLATENGNSATIANDAALNFVTTVGTQTQITVLATYTGTLQATITAPPQQWLLGSTEFTVTSTATAGLVLNPSDSFQFVITFSPTNANPAGAQLTIPFTEPGAGGTPVKNSILLGLQGSSPAFTLSYVLQSDNNVIQIPPGGTIPFKPTLINTTVSANLNISDTGSGQGVITGVSLTAGSPIFKLQGTPLFPYALTPGGAAATLTLLVTYSPTAVESDTGQIQITYQGGATATVNLTGSGVTSAFTYTYLVGGKATTVKPGGTIQFPGANVGTASGTTGTSSLIVQVTNTGSATGTINSVSTSGPFTLTDPVTLPATLTTGNSFSVPLTFTPTQVGTQTGQLLIGNDFFILSGQGQGPKLTFAYTSSAGTTTVDPATGGAVVFSPTEVGQSEQVSFTVTNSGSLPATIANIGTTPANGPYSLPTPPPLPLILAPSASATFKISFKPTATGFSDGTLILDTTSIPLIGSGSAPPTLPTYTITGPSGNASPLTQSNVSLTLSSAYSLDLTGVLTITTEGTLGTDPAVQFATGGRTVDFTIPANSTSANFAGQGSELPLQTGTVAETVTLTPTFAAAGGVDVTPASPTTLQFTIPSVAPVLLSAQVAGQTANSFSLSLVGYSTTRSLGSLNVTFNPATGFNIGTSQLTIDLSQVSGVWFESSASTSFGGQFQVTMPFILTGPVKTGQTLLQSLASVTATVSNSIGTSNSLQTSVQ
jgi:hypothetical protein